MSAKLVEGFPSARARLDRRGREEILGAVGRKGSGTLWPRTGAQRTACWHRHRRRRRRRRLRRRRAARPPAVRAVTQSQRPSSTRAVLIHALGLGLAARGAPEAPAPPGARVGPGPSEPSSQPHQPSLSTRGSNHRACGRGAAPRPLPTLARTRGPGWSPRARRATVRAAHCGRHVGRTVPTPAAAPSSGGRPTPPHVPPRPARSPGRRTAP